MGIFSVVFAFILVSAVGAALWIWWVKTTLETAAADRNLEYFSGGFVGASVSGEFRGHDVGLQYGFRDIANRSNSPLMLEYRVDLDVEIPEDFQILGAGYHRLRGLGADELRVDTGDLDFDDAFRVESTDRAAAYDVLDDDELRQQLLRHPASINPLKSQFSNRYVKFDGQSLHVFSMGIPPGVDSIFDRLEEVVDTADRLEERIDAVFGGRPSGHQQSAGGVRSL